MGIVIDFCRCYSCCCLSFFICSIILPIIQTRPWLSGKGSHSRNGKNIKNRMNYVDIEIDLEEYLASQFSFLPISTIRGKRKISVLEERKESGVK